MYVFERADLVVYFCIPPTKRCRECHRRGKNLGRVDVFHNSERFWPDQPDILLLFNAPMHQLMTIWSLLTMCLPVLVRVLDQMLQSAVSSVGRCRDNFFFNSFTFSNENACRCREVDWKHIYRVHRSVWSFSGSSLHRTSPCPNSSSLHRTSPPPNSGFSNHSFSLVYCIILY